MLLVQGKERHCNEKMVRVEKKPSTRRLKPHDRVILDALWRAQKPLTTKQVSERSGTTWITAKRHLESLARRKLLAKHVGTNRIYWRLS